MQAYVIDLAEVKERAFNNSGLVFEVIGGHGLSRYPEIKERVIDLGRAQNNNMTDYRIRSETHTLKFNCLVAEEKISHPLHSVFLVYSLTEMGTIIYSQKYGKPPVMSERDRIIADYGNLEDGYAIKAIAEMFINAGYYTT